MTQIEADPPEWLRPTVTAVYLVQLVAFGALVATVLHRSWSPNAELLIGLFVLSTLELGLSVLCMATRSPRVRAVAIGSFVTLLLELVAVGWFLVTLSANVSRLQF